MADLPSPDRAAVIAALNSVRDPKSGRGLAAAGLVQGLVVAPGRAGFMMEVAAEDAALYAPVREAAERALSQLPGVERAQVVLTAAASSRGAAPADPQVVRVRRGAKMSDAAQAQNAPPPR